MGHQNWPVGQAVKTPPFHGGIRGSIPLPVTIIRSLSSAGRASALQAECRRFDPVSDHHFPCNLIFWPGGSVGQNAALSRRRSRVRVPSGSPFFMREQLSGRAPPCQGGGREFEPRFPLQIWRHSQAVRQRSAKPLSPVRFRVSPPYLFCLPRWRNWQTQGT